MTETYEQMKARHAREVLQFKTNYQFSATSAALTSVSNWLDVTRAELVGPKRTAAFVIPRHVAMKVLSQLRPDMSLSQIGRVFNRDHTTVIHALQQLERRVKANPDLKRTLGLCLGEARRLMKDTG